MIKSIKKIIGNNIYWYKEGTEILHREDGPAIEYDNGYKEYYLNGKYHREDGPAIERANGDKFYCLNGKLHREDGPAIEYVDGVKAYYYHGEHIKCSTNKEFKQSIKMKAFW